MTEKKVILYVEDERDSRESVRRDLEREGYCIVDYDNCESAKRSIADGLRFDLALIDRGGLMGSNELIWLIRKKNPDMPIVTNSIYQDKVRGVTINVSKVHCMVDEELLARTIGGLLGR